MDEAYTGGCACGAIRYEISGEPMAMNHCQCRQCQSQTGTGHGSYLTFPKAAAKITGEGREWEVVGDGGTVKRSGFCPACGSPVYLTLPAIPDIFLVRAGSLDDPSRFSPGVVLWTAAGLAWDHLDPALTRFEKMPPQV